MEEKNFLVYGTGLSGINAANLLINEGKNVILYDGNSELDVENVRKKLDNPSINIIKGELSDDVLDGTDMLILSPGISPENLIVQRFEWKQIPVIGEIELAYRFEKGSVIAITGTNGKTTTTTLVGDIMKEWNEKTIVVGNIGYPYTEEVRKTSRDSETVAEVSSFQLETIDEFHPHVSAILNITPDHLDRHHTMENYAAAKYRITMNQDYNDFCILNYDDVRLREFATRCHAQVIWFGRINKPSNGFYYRDNIIYKVKDNEETEVCNVNDLKLLGTHNYENVMAAFAITEAAGVNLDVAVKVAKDFNAVEHRIEFVEAVDGVNYYNDSKGTNPDAAIKAIEAMNRPTVLIAGGYDKNSEYDEFIESFNGKVKELVLIGATADKIKKCAEEKGFMNIHKATDLGDAVRMCKELASDGDAVLLSPACASWDMFKSYEERGRLFKDYVRN